MTKRVCVNGDDIDLLLVLFVGLSGSSRKLFFCTPGKSDTPGEDFVQHLRIRKDKLSPRQCPSRACIYGCDTTSAQYGKGKERTGHSVKSNSKLRTAIENVYHANTSHADIFPSGCTSASRILHDAPQTKTSLNRYRFTSFRFTTLKHEAKSLCPTEGAARQHAYRVYLQIPVTTE